jgi:hypothetical protein
VLYRIRTAKVDYLLVDLRLTMARSAMGEYFETGEPGGGEIPPAPSSFLKFDDPRVSRVFDNGYIVIFDVRGLRDHG